ncbi:MAG: hypothetical protein AAF993_18670 [Pseudomonadota bacterium]
MPESTVKISRRIAGLSLLLGALLSFSPGQSGLLHQVILPLLIGLGAWLVLGSLLAVALAGSIVAAVHSNLDSSDWVLAYLYPTICALCTLVVAIICVRRFRTHINNTRHARWQRKSEGRATQGNHSSGSSKSSHDHTIDPD